MATRSNLPHLTRVGLVGLAGYANNVADILCRASEGQAPCLRLSDLFVADPEPVQPRIDKLVGKGVTTHDSYDALLKSGIDAVWLPVPIHLHRPMTQAALSAGLTVMVEKPVAGSLADALKMIRARDRAERAVLVGYQNLYEPSIYRLKTWLREAAGGHPLRATVTGGWPRGEAYFGRNDWAGRIRLGSEWIRDSPANNAFAHFLNLALFLLGPDPDTPAMPRNLVAEAYRVNAIESYDTISLRVGCEDNVEIVANLTHACRDTFEPVVTIAGARHLVDWRHNDRRVRLLGDQGEGALWRDVDPLVAMSERLAEVSIHRKTPPVGPVATLETSLPHAVLVEGIDRLVAITNVPSSEVRQVAAGKGNLRFVEKLDRALRVAHTHGLMLNETGLLPWTRPGEGGELDVEAKMIEHRARSGAPTSRGDACVR